MFFKFFLNYAEQNHTPNLKNYNLLPLQTSYLAGFSCEISWILEAKGNLPTGSYLLCAGYFILFIASTILIHGLATVSLSTFIQFLKVKKIFSAENGMGFT